MGSIPHVTHGDRGNLILVTANKYVRSTSKNTIKIHVLLVQIFYVSNFHSK